MPNISTNREHLADFRKAVGNLSANPYLNRLKEVTEELVSLHRELALLVFAEKQQRREAWEAANTGSVSGNDRYTDHATLDLAGDVITMKGEIAAYIEERDFLRLLIEKTS